MFASMQHQPSFGVSSNEPDMSLISDLLDAIDHDPTAIEPRKLMMQQYKDVGWLDAAKEAARELCKIDPNDNDALACLSILDPIVTNPGPYVQPSATPYKPVVPPRISDPESGRASLVQGCNSLRDRAKKLQDELRNLQNLQDQQGNTNYFDKHILEVAAIVDGQFSTIARGKLPTSGKTPCNGGQPNSDGKSSGDGQPGSVRSTANAMGAKPNEALEIAISDLMDMVRWLQSKKRSSSSNIRRATASTLPGAWPETNSSSADDMRDTVVKRVQALEAALPSKLRFHAASALMHVEHEVLARTYVNHETMVSCEPISDIPRDHFWVSEDGYAWDMEELAQAITSKSGVMRNPLSMQMFTPHDVRSIVKHPLGKGLAALQMDQSKLSKGVRPKTVDRLENLGKVLLQDQSTDQIPSRHAVDEFLTYVATLPDAEQDAIERLRVPANDSHTGQGFDTTIGEAVQDAQANRVCSHKTGDFLSQAARYLRTQ